MFVHVLITQGDTRFHAHALDFDLMTIGDTAGEALDHLTDQIELYVSDCIEQGMSSFDEIQRKAPQEYFDKFEEVFKNPDAHFSIAKLSLPIRFNPSSEQAAATLA